LNPALFANGGLEIIYIPSPKQDYKYQPSSPSSRRFLFKPNSIDLFLPVAISRATTPHCQARTALLFDDSTDPIRISSMATLDSIPEVCSPSLQSCFFFPLFILHSQSDFFYFQNLRHNLTIPINDKPGFIYLGPMGDPDPSYLINSETNRIPFKSSPINLDDWNQTFWSWPNVTIGWKNWYHKMATSKRADWD
jgi:hypothetical protein